MDSLMKLVSVLLTTFVVNGAKVNLYRYWHGGIVDHFYTTNWNELKGGKHGWKYEGIQCQIESLSSKKGVELYRYWNAGIGDHFYTTNIAELGNGRHGWVKEGSPGKCFRTKKPGTLPLYRYWNGRDHFYTTHEGEIGVTTPGQTGKHGYKSEGITCYVYPKPNDKIPKKPIPLYRYWNAGNTDHFYTTNWAELGGGKGGWKYEGIQCQIESLNSGRGDKILYRYWNAGIGDHFYTTNYAELGAGRSGWVKETPPGRCYSTKANNNLVPLYRYWSGSDHFYTTNAAEIGTTTPGKTGKHGYKSEGITCYVYPSNYKPGPIYKGRCSNAGILNQIKRACNDGASDIKTDTGKITTQANKKKCYRLGCKCMDATPADDINQPQMYECGYDTMYKINGFAPPARSVNYGEFDMSDFTNNNDVKVNKYADLFSKDVVIAVIISVVVGLLLGVIASQLICMCLRKKNKNYKKVNFESSEDEDEGTI